MVNVKKYDLVILGGGAAAFAAANRANQLKRKTLLVNDKNILPLGGTCVNIGCVPSKIMLHQGAEAYYPERNGFKGVTVKGKANLVVALKETRAMVEKFREKNYERVIESQDRVDFKEGRASFIDSHTIRVGGESFEGKFMLIATGASTYVPEIKGVKEIDYLTSKNFLNLSKTPKSVIIIGGGPLGMEFSQIFSHFGVQTTVLQQSDRIIPRFDPVLGVELEKYLKEEGITIHTNARTKEVRKTKAGVGVLAEINGKEETIVAEKLMLATGLSPNTKDINAERANVTLTEKGFVQINERMQTSQKHIYAAGDVTGIMPLETVAAKQGSLAVLNMFEQDLGGAINYYEVPQTLFTSPEVAAVGITEEEFMRKYNTCSCRTMTMDHVEKALAVKDARGLIKMVIDPKTKVVVGVHMIGPMAADIITTATYAVKNKMTIYDIRDTVHVFPTMSEAIKKVAQSFEQDLNKMACCVE